MNSTKVLPLIFLGTAIGQIRRGEYGMAIMLLCGVAVIVLVDWAFEEDRERRRRKYEAERRRSRT